MEVSQPNIECLLSDQTSSKDANRHASLSNTESMSAQSGKSGKAG